MALTGALPFTLSINFTTACYSSSNPVTSTFDALIDPPQICYEAFFRQAYPKSLLKGYLRQLSLLSQDPVYSKRMQQALRKPGNPLYRLFFDSGTLKERCDEYTSLGKVVSLLSKFMQTGSDKYALNNLDPMIIKEASLEANELLSQSVAKTKDATLPFFSRLGELIQSDLDPPAFFQRLWSLLPGPTLVSGRPIPHSHEIDQKPFVHNPPLNIKYDRDTSFMFYLSKDTFRDSYNGSLTHFAKLANGDSLPNWMNFFDDHTGQYFEGKTPKEYEVYYISVEAANLKNLSNSAVFKFRVKPTGPFKGKVYSIAIATGTAACAYLVLLKLGSLLSECYHRLNRIFRVPNPFRNIDINHLHRLFATRRILR